MGDGMKLGRTLPLKGGDEYDALTKWKKFLKWRAGQRKAIKRAYNKRQRRSNLRGL